MFEELFYIHSKSTESVPMRFYRYLHNTIDWNAKHICITGYRGSGKTTLLLQHYLERYNDVEKCLYISADNVAVSAIGIYKIATEYFKLGGEAIIIDEVHKFPGWKLEIKSIIDTFSNKRVLISGSSSLNLLRGKGDLSRRVVYYNLHELSFREYLELTGKRQFPACTLEQILTDHISIAQAVCQNFPVLKYFNKYLLEGAYPFIAEGNSTYTSKLLNVIEKVIYEDIAIAGEMKQGNLPVLKNILWIIASSVPFVVNIGKMSREIGVSKEYVYRYLEYLDRAGMINTVAPQGRGYKISRKPSKILIENSNLLFAVNNAMMSESQRGTVRETFFVSQLKNNHNVLLSEKGDFVVDDRYTFEIGGPGKGSSRLTGIKETYIAADGIETGFAKRIPLYLFGMLY